MAGEVQRWFDRVPEPWAERAQRLRELVLDAAPGMDERWMFKSAPFYLRHGWLVYFALQQGRLVVGFCNGVHMLDPEGLFASTDHKLIRHYLPPEPPARLNEAAFQRLVMEAVALNEELAAQRKLRRPKRARR